MTEVIRDQFQASKRHAKHMPTGAMLRWSRQPGDGVELVERGRIGEVLPNGEVYEKGDVVRVGLRLMMEMLEKQRKE